MMSITRHHNDWQKLVESSGPFLTMPVLMRVFPQGLHSPAREKQQQLWLAYQEWRTSHESGRPNPAIHHTWVRFVLRDLLGFPDALLVGAQAVPESLIATLPEHGETLRPDFALMNPTVAGESGAARLLIQYYSHTQPLDQFVANRRWNAPPRERMIAQLRAAKVSLGLVTNGAHWMLVHAPPRDAPPSHTTWNAALWREEPLTLQSFCSLLEAHRFFSVEEKNTLEALFRESGVYQQEVTDQLGLQVRRAVEILVRAIDRIDRDRSRCLLAGVEEKQLYQAALTVMMRLVFLFSAEENDLLLLGDPLYDEQYAVSTLRAQLYESAKEWTEEVLERRFDAWSRLLATFRAVYGGVEHDRLRLPAHGSSLFDPDRFPFLEGRPAGTRWHETPADPLPINNRTVLHLLEALQVLQVKVTGGAPEARLLSFRALDVEQIGHIYEGLLDHTAKRAEGPVLGLTGTKNKEPEVPLAELERSKAKGNGPLIQYLREQTGRSESALSRLVAAPLHHDDGQLRSSCDGEEELVRRVRPFAGLLRHDDFDCPVVIPVGSVYVTSGDDRRSTGTHYTPRSLTEPIVRHTLEPLVYTGVAEGVPPSPETLRTPEEILALRVCDMATGSGAFLVQACRYLSEKLVEAWARAEEQNPGQPLAAPAGQWSEAKPEERLLPRDATERLTLARRLVAERCLYGVDVNPMALEMAKLSLWLITMQKGCPFTFLDHALKCGDSLLGVDMDQLRAWSLDRSELKTLDLFVAGHIRKAIGLREDLAWLPERGINDIQAKERLNHQAEAAMSHIKLAGDLIVAPWFGPGQAQEQQKERERLLHHYNALDTAEANLRLRDRADELLAGRRPFHWPLEFPEVFMGDRRGFDAIVGNPPFLGGQKITGTLGTQYRDYLVQHIANGQRGSADLCAYFFLRARHLVREGGGFGLLATNTIAQGDTREVGLDQLLADGCVVPRAVPSRKWPGLANVEVAHVWVRRGAWDGPHVLNDALVPGITPFLTAPGETDGKPYRLATNAGKSSIGSYVLGMGFVLAPEEAEELIDRDPRNGDVLVPYLNGEDLNSRPDQSPSRWVINFHDWPLERAEKYPDCMRIVREKVKPERDQNNRKVRRERWWQFAERAPELYATIAGMGRVLACALVSRQLIFALVTNTSVFAHKLAVFPMDDWSSLAMLQSEVHVLWAWQYSSTMRDAGINYSPSDCFDTFPFPTGLGRLNETGETYYLHRQSIMQARHEGLTKTYSRCHSSSETAEDIARLRELHVEMDHAVAAAYGWTELDLGHDFHETKQGMRFTISEPARREVLGRLLRLNHERYAEEVVEGLHEKIGRNGKAKRAGTRKIELAPIIREHCLVGQGGEE
jgi:hypothetical protein